VCKIIIQVIGLPGSGKTTFAKELSDRINAVHLNADAVRAELNKDLGFSAEDRLEQARRMGALSRLLSDQGYHVVVDFVNPTAETRALAPLPFTMPAMVPIGA
jgi:adenylylsulfate kinase-like enzyme